jgi:hypothetical protein
LKLHGTYQLLVDADDVNILGGSVHTINKKAEALVVASKENGLEEDAAKTKYMVMSRDQNAERSHNIKIDNSSFEREEEFKYLAKTLTNESSIQEVSKSRLKACHHSVTNFLSSSLLSINLKSNIYRTHRRTTNIRNYSTKFSCREI